MNSDSEQISRHDVSTNTHSQKLLTAKPMSNVKGRQRKNSAWEGHLSELTEYHKVHGHCNVSQHDRENTKLGSFVGTQRRQYRLHLEGKKSDMTTLRIQESESLGFNWVSHRVAWQDRLSELVDYHKIQGHCNVPKNFSENSKPSMLVLDQRRQCRLHLEGKKSYMTPLRIQELESLGFNWGFSLTAWEDRLSKLADFRKIQGHSNVPRDFSENSKLGIWVSTQRNQYRLPTEGKLSYMTTFRIQELEKLGFEWKPSISRGKGKPKKPRLNDDVTRSAHERAVESPECNQHHRRKETSALEKAAAIKLTSLSKVTTTVAPSL